MSISIWTRASPRRKRILSVIAVLIVAIIITVIGSFTPISQQDAQNITKDLNQTVTTGREQGTLAPYIFGNNLFICLLMFVPIIGPIAGLFILYTTGTVVGAIAISGGYSPALALIALFITPVAWLEFAAYSTAMAESVWLFRRLLQGRGIPELRKNTVLFITIAVVLLAVGAIVETALINFAG
ncbi:MAG TPA: stage II sporulation protein M [Candidatus Sulfotelmatobacter sp.]|nr:stage II sporulation protein M [Candidatus Sulfotelmatobacter sp.]